MFLPTFLLLLFALVVDQNETRRHTISQTLKQTAFRFFLQMRWFGDVNL